MLCCSACLLCQGPQRHRKECSRPSGDSAGDAQQTSHGCFDEGGESPEGQGGSGGCRIQAPAVSRDTWTIRRLRKPNPLHTGKCIADNNLTWSVVNQTCLIPLHVIWRCLSLHGEVGHLGTWTIRASRKLIKYMYYLIYSITFKSIPKFL